jgi:hypothetical protein
MKDVVLAVPRVYTSVYVAPLTVSVPFVVVPPWVAAILDVPFTPLMRSRLPHISATDELLLV